jgi:hypothetical protein
MTYDPNVGQFVSLDPSERLGENWAPLMVGGTPDPTNSYCYGGNDPVDNVDSRPLFTQSQKLGQSPPVFGKDSN